MTAVELKGLATIVSLPRITPEGCKGLNRRRRQGRQQLCEMGAAAHIAEHFTDGLAEATDQVEARSAPDKLVR